MLKALLAFGAALTLTACASTVSGQGSVAGAPTDAGRHRGPSGFPSTTTAPSGSSASPPATSGPSGANAALSADQLEQKAKRAMLSATSFRLHGSGDDGDDGLTIGIDIRYGRNSSLGTLTVSGIRVDLLYAAGTVYMRSSDEFWEGILSDDGVSDVDAAVARVHGKWVAVPAGNDDLAGLADLAVRTKFLAEVASSDDSSYEKGPSRTIDGVPAVSFVDIGDGSVIYVPTSGPAYPLQIEDPSSDNGGTFELSDWNVAFTAQPPSPTEVAQLPH